MKTLINQIIAIVVLGLFSISVSADTTYSDRTELKFPKPSNPGLLRIVSGSGDITVEGYDGQEVMIEIKSSAQNVLNPPEDEKAKGMKRISGFGLSVSSVEEENAIVITRSMKNEADLFIKVPFDTSLQLGGGTVSTLARITPSNGPFGPMGPNVNIDRIFDNIDRILDNVFSSLNSPGMFVGNITISDVSGEIEANTRGGNINLNSVSGEVVANSVEGELLITFKEMTKKKPMAFSTIDGDIDMTLPSNTKATISAKNVDGNIYTDFDMDIIHVEEVDGDRNQGWRHGLSGMFGNTVTGEINGGGAEILISTVDGNIYIRKGQ